MSLSNSSSSSSSSSSASGHSAIEENCEMHAPRTELLVRDFGWPSVSPRYHGDHSPESNPDWDHDPLQGKEAKQKAVQKMERSYAMYLANMDVKRPLRKKKTWGRFLPWGR